MFSFKKNVVFSFLFFALLFGCSKSNELVSPDDFLSKVLSTNNIVKEYKTWEVNEGIIERVGLPTIRYKKNEAINNNFDASKISYVFSSIGTFNSVDEKGKEDRGTWVFTDDKKKIKLAPSNGIIETYDVIQITKDNFDISSEETDGNVKALITLKMIPK